MCFEWRQPANTLDFIHGKYECVHLRLHPYLQINTIAFVIVCDRVITVRSENV